MLGWSLTQKSAELLHHKLPGAGQPSKMKKAAKMAIEQWGVGPAAVRSIAGTQALHIQLETTPGRIQGRGRCPVRPERFCANQAAIPTLVGQDKSQRASGRDLSDRPEHASPHHPIAARLSGARSSSMSHCDARDAERVIKENMPNFRVAC